MKIFLSLPMKDVPWPEIEANIAKMKGDILDRISEIPSAFGVTSFDGLEIDFVFVDNLYGEQPPKDIKHPRTWYVSEAIKKIADCDFVYFHEQWDRAPGCIIEHAVCTQHNIPIIYASNIVNNPYNNRSSDRLSWQRDNGRAQVDPQSHYKKALKNAFDEAEWFFTGVMNEMNERDIQDCHDMVNAIVDAAVLKYEWKKSILEDKDGEA